MLLRPLPDRIDTERLVLRRFTPADAPAYAAIRAEPEVAQALGYTTSIAGDRARWFQELNERSWRELGVGAWAVELRESGALLGHAGLWYVEQFDAIEVLYAYTRAAWGQGIATEAARASVELAFDELGLERVIGLVAPDNHRSLGVLRKLGFRELGEALHRGHRLLLHELERSVHRGRTHQQ